MLHERVNWDPRTSPVAGEAIASLQKDGYAILRSLAPRDLIERLNSDLDGTFNQTPPSSGLFYGESTRRFGGLLKRSAVARLITMDPVVLTVMEEFLKPHCDSIQLSLMQAIELAPNAPAQVPHRDEGSWGGEKGRMEYMVSIMWPLTPFSRENGATLVWPQSHGGREVDPFSAGMPAEMIPGDALIFLGSTMHASGANLTTMHRRGLIISYCLGWLKPHENQWLVYPPAVAKRFPPELAALVGYRRHRPNLNNYEGQCPSILLKDHIPEFIPALDEFPEGLNQLILAYQAELLSRANATGMAQPR